MALERHQNPIIGSDLKLRLVSMNSNNFVDVSSVDKVEIYWLDPASCTEECPDGATLLQTIEGDDVTQDDTGQYSVTLSLTAPTYVIGQYKDLWYVSTTLQNEQDGIALLTFEIFPDLWYFSSLPPVYSFDFRFQPNRIRQGSVKHLIIQIIPNVPRATDLEKYYLNLAISSTLRISIERACGPCVPPEADLRIIVDRELVELREKVFAYYQIDTRDLECGIYNVWFELEFAGNIDISEKYQLQIF